VKKLLWHVPDALIVLGVCGIIAGYQPRLSIATLCAGALLFVFAVKK